MTPDKPKCEHWSVDRRENYVEADGSPIGDGWFCHDCNARFVPSDVLEEARVSLLQLKTALESGTELWGPDLGQYIKSHGPHEYLSDAFAVLAKIDGVLGKP